MQSHFPDRKKSNLKSLIAPCLVLLALGSPSGAQEVEAPLPFDAVPADAASPFGGMSISPTRIMMQAGRGGEQVTLYNTGGEAVTYRVDLIDFAIDETGAYRELAEGEAATWSAAAYVRFAPRQVTLGPGERQTVRFIATAPRDLPATQLRSHVRFSSIPTVAPVAEDTPQEDGTDTGTVSISVGLAYRISVPLLLTIGEPAAGTEISDVRFSSRDDGAPAAEVILRRTGARSTYGTVLLLAEDGSEVAAVRNVAVLPPAETRRVSVPLPREGPRPARVVFDEQLDGTNTGARLSDVTIP
jgi:hypothetical protein